MKEGYRNNRFCYADVKKALTLHSKCHCTRPSKTVSGKHINDYFQMKTLIEDKKYQICHNIFYKIKQYKPTTKKRKRIVDGDGLLEKRIRKVVVSFGEEKEIIFRSYRDRNEILYENICYFFHK